MAFQLVYTSAAKLLDAGRSGYGTVARSKAITPLVVSAIERVSQFANQRGLERHRVIYVHRRITAGSNRFHVLTRIVDAGADYTGRTNHLAHHLVISQEEAARAAARGVTPADVLRQFSWLGRWDKSARFFDSSEDVALENFMPDGKDSKPQSWASVTGNPAHARLLSFDGAPRTGVLIVPEGVDSLVLLAEALSEFGPQSWSRSFTTSLETTDELSDLEWIVTTPGAFLEIQQRCGSRTLLDLTNPGILPLPPAPAIPTPQLAPASNPQTGPGVYTPPAPDLATRQSSSNPVQVRVAETGAGATAASLRRSNSKADKKTQIKLVAGLAALLFFLGLIVFLAIKEPNSDKKTDASTSAPQITEHEKAINAVKKAGVSPKGAEDAVSSVGDKNSENLAGFVTDFISGLEKVKPGDDFKGVREFNAAAPNAPEWLNALVAARKAIGDYAEASSVDKDLSKCLELLGTATGHLKVAANTQALDDLTKETCDKFDSALARREIEKLFESGTKSHPIGEQLKAAIVAGQLNKDKFPARYAVLFEVIKDYTDKPPFKAVFESLYAGIEAITTPDIDHLKVALKCGAISDGKPTTEKTDEIKTPKSEPDPIKGMVAKPAEAGHEDTPLPLSLNFSGVHSKQIIVVTRSQLKGGIECTLLKVLLENHSESILKIDGLSIFIDGENFGIQALTLNVAENCYVDKWLDPKIRLFRSGKLQMDLNHDPSIEVQFNNLNKGFKLLVVVDAPTTTYLIEDLKFEYRSIDKDGIVIDGELADWIADIKLQENDKQQLDFLFEPQISPFSVAKLGKKWQLTRPPQKLPDITFSERDAEAIRDDLRAFIDAAPKSGVTKGEKAKSEVGRNNSLAALKSTLSNAVGGGLLCKALGLESEHLITQDHLPKAYEILERNYKGRKDGARYPDFKNAVKDIKKQIGEVKLGEIMQNLGAIPWEEIEKPATTNDSIKASFDKILNNTKKPEPRKSMEDELKKIKSLSVQTKSGRVLFQAEPPPKE